MRELAPTQPTGGHQLAHRRVAAQIPAAERLISNADTTRRMLGTIEISRNARNTENAPEVGDNAIATM